MTLVDLLSLARRHLRLVIALPLVFAAITAAICWFVLPNTYTSSVSIYVLARNSSEETSALNSELSAGQMITNDVATLIESTRVITQTAQSFGLEDLDDFTIDIDSTTNTRVITINVSGTSPSFVAAVANELASVTNQVAREAMDVRSVNVLDEAIIQTEPSGPPRILYTLIAFVIGLFVALAAIVLMDTLNAKIRGPEEIEELLGIPVIGRIPYVKN